MHFHLLSVKITAQEVISNIYFGLLKPLFFQVEVFGIVGGGAVIAGLATAGALSSFSPVVAVGTIGRTYCWAFISWSL